MCIRDRSTTDEAGAFDGPDFSNGWGLFNAEKAAEVITNNGLSSSIIETSLNQDEVFSTTITVDGTQPLSVAICWNDPAAIPLVNAGHNDPTPMLVNDLDVRIISDSEEFFPWKMEPNETFDNYEAAAVKGDNFRDNIEIISEGNIPAGTYTILVSHKNALQSGSQDFSLVINGMSDELSSTDASNMSNQLIRVFPNPASNRISIDFSTSIQGPLEVHMFDLKGQKQLEARFENQESMNIDVSSLASGSYILQVRSEDSTILGTTKVVVE